MERIARIIREIRPLRHLFWVAQNVSEASRIRLIRVLFNQFNPVVILLSKYKVKKRTPDDYQE